MIRKPQIYQRFKFQFSPASELIHLIPVGPAEAITYPRDWLMDGGSAALPPFLALNSMNAIDKENPPLQPIPAGNALMSSKVGFVVKAIRDNP